VNEAPIGTFAVSASAADVSAFCRAAHLPDGDALPFTYPIRWLARPEVRAGLTVLVPESDLVPFHESQSFDYARPLRRETAYALAVTARREHAPERLVVAATISAEDGTVAATIETVLRLFSTQRA